jgi:aspartate/methionine/tyrosine aminotransferase
VLSRRLSVIAKRAQEIEPFLVMEVLERAVALEAQGENVIHLEIGEPDFQTPDCIQEAAIQALRDGKTGYTHSLGILPLREAIAEHYHARYGVEVSPDRILVTTGTSPAMWMIFAAILETGDQVLLSDPHYACYPNFIRFCGGEPVGVDVFEEDGFQLRPEAVRNGVDRRTKAILINSPANPTGTLLSAERMAAIAEMGPLVLSDEIYHGLVYEGREHSILEFTDRAVVLNGFSKAFAMTGWRLGYVIVPPELIRPLQKMHQNFFISANAFVQAAGVAALREGQGETARMPPLSRPRPAPPGVRRGHGADGGVLCVRQCQTLHHRLPRLRLRDPGTGQGGRRPRDRLRPERGGLPALLLCAVAGRSAGSLEPPGGFPGPPEVVLPRVETGTHVNRRGDCDDCQAERQLQHHHARGAPEPGRHAGAGDLRHREGRGRYRRRGHRRLRQGDHPARHHGERPG